MEQTVTVNVPSNIKITPKPRFFVIVAIIVFGTILLWDQSVLLHALHQASSQVCRPMVIPEVKELPPPKVVVPYTTTVNPTDLVKVRDLRKFYLASDQSDGKIVLRTGGTVPWRLNNPG